jgi:hypothetical protein
MNNSNFENNKIVGIVLFFAGVLMSLESTVFSLKLHVPNRIFVLPAISGVEALTSLAGLLFMFSGVYLIRRKQAGPYEEKA